MNELIRFLSEREFPLEKPILNGKITRFKRAGQSDKNCWFIGWEHYGSKSGKPFIIACCGDWSTGESHEFRTNDFDYSREDLKAIKLRQQQMAKQREQETAALQEATAKKAIDIWSKATEGPLNPYCTRKGLKHHYGSRYDADTNEQLVPVRDITGKLWGVQRLIPSGDKFFLPGSKKMGCFAQIPHDREMRNEDQIFICEGFATAATVHEATGDIVLVAFDAGNLEPVAKAARNKMPNAVITICSDNDQFGEKNTGVIKATEAAKAAGATVVTPYFEDLSTKPTDFNDLATLHGIDAVKKQILESNQGAIYLRSLGHHQGDYYYTSSSNQHIVCLSRAGHSENTLLDLMPVNYWMARFPGPRGVDWTNAKSFLMEQCRKQGVFTTEKIRGVGAWQDEGRLVLNLGNRLLCDGREYKLSAFPTSNTYILGKHLPSPPETPLTNDEISPLLDALDTPLWTAKATPALVGGWSAISRLCGALPWRPMMWLTSEFGHGKSTFIEKVVKRCTGDFGVYPLGRSTEPGLRRKLQSDARPVVFDESETNDRHSGLRIQNMLALARLSSSEGTGEVYLADQDGGVQSFSCKSAFFLASIRVNLQEQADQSRFTVVEVSNGFKYDKDTALERYSKLTEEFSERLFRRSIILFPLILRNMNTYERVLSKAGYTPREAQQLGTLLAGYTSLTNDGIITEGYACDTIRNLELQKASQAEPEVEADHVACLDHLLGTTLVGTYRDNRWEGTVAEAIEQASSDPLFVQVLRRFGLDLADDGRLFVANNHPGLAPIFRGTKWEHGWTDTLRRRPGSRKERHRFAGKHTNQLQSISVPLPGESTPDSPPSAPF